MTQHPPTGTLWIDITDLMSWNGSLTGIQRAQFHLSQEFSSMPHVKFFSAHHSKGFAEVSLPQADYFAQMKRKPGFREQSKISIFSGKAVRFSSRVMHKVLPRKASEKIDRLSAGISGTIADLTFRVGEKTSSSALPPHPFTQQDSVLILGAIWGTAGLPEIICRLKRAVGFRLIFTVHDLIPIYAPHFFNPGFGPHFSRFLMDTVEASDILLSNSQHTTSDVQRFISDLNIPEVPIITFRLGDNPVDVIADTSPSAEIIPGEFVLVVGTVEVRKNHQALYLAWELAAKEDIELPPLVIVGRPGWNVNDLLYDINTNPLVKNNITIISDVNDDTLGWLYRNCLLTVYPSWYEGWGLPVAESLHFGKLCISSNASSMPEIGGDLVEYCSPYEPRAFMEKIAHYYSSPKALAAAEKKIAQKYAGTSWKESFHHIWDGLQEHTS